jgi:hypothetical protein
MQIIGRATSFCRAVAKCQDSNLSLGRTFGDTPKHFLPIVRQMCVHK